MCFAFAPVIGWQGCLQNDLQCVKWDVKCYCYRWCWLYGCWSCMLAWRSAWKRCSSTTCRGLKCSFLRKPSTFSVSVGKHSCTHMYLPSTSGKTTSLLYLRCGYVTTVACEFLFFFHLQSDSFDSYTVHFRFTVTLIHFFWTNAACALIMVQCNTSEIKTLWWIEMCIL